MTTLRSIHKFMNERRYVRLSDGRTGKIVRIDTTFPANDTVVTLWTESATGPGVTKVRLDDVVGTSEPPRAASAGATE